MDNQYLCSRARDFFSRLASDDARAWAHLAIDVLRETYPKIDVWATGGYDQYVDIRMGRRGAENARGAPVFYLNINSSSKYPDLWGHDDIRASIQPQPLTRENSPTKDNIRDWLRQHVDQIAPRLNDLTGEAHNPIEYEKVSGPQVTSPSNRDDSLSGNVSVISVQGLNKILFGPPGTGKTFSTIEHALAILEPALLANSVRRDVRKIAFDHYVENKQIVFVTFHQSFSYEDFVEGLRAVTAEGQLEYVVESGVFKSLCERASAGVLASDDPFEKAVESFMAQLEQNGGFVEMQTPSGRKFKVTYNGGNTFGFVPESRQELDPEGLEKYRANMTYVRKLFSGADPKGMYNISYVRGMLNYLKEKCGLPAAPAAVRIGQPKKPFVLVIDEINRGNVSRIFGELITLIEPSKRAGQAEALEVILPYSKERFSIPDNVYLIGTMNTADRSLASLDIALRRRFEFVEMPPRPELLDDVLVIAVGATGAAEVVDVGQLLRVINERIEVLLDRDHCLGHAYFMSLQRDPSLTTLSRIFRTNVIPLLQEYFFEDWQRIAWVLNDHRKPKEFRFLEEPKTNLADMFGRDIGINTQGKRWKLNESAFNAIASYTGVISVSGANEG